jgi:ABC-type lipoprotein export system ATPase subunit
VVNVWKVVLLMLSNMNEDIKKITIFSGLNKVGIKENFQKIDINKGDVVAIVGPTGAGKSQFLYDLDRLAQGDTKSKRKIFINNKIPEKEWKLDPKKKIIASLSQSMNFLTDSTVENFLKLHIQARGKKTDLKLIKETIDEANKITGEAITPDTNLLNLSGGQSRALMVSDLANISISPIILIDEIENAGIKKEQAIKILTEEGKIVLIVTHDPSLALNAQKRIIINNGGVVNVIKTTMKEKGIARYLNWTESCVLKIRDQIRSGEQIKDIKLFCEKINKI